jgi:hypothetical protein
MAREQRCATTARATDDDGARRVEDDRATDEPRVEDAATRDGRATDARELFEFFEFFEFRRDD